MGIVILKKLSN